MALGDWGAMVFVNGTRDSSREDCDYKENNWVHALLGDEEFGISDEGVIIAITKTIGELFVDGKLVGELDHTSGYGYGWCYDGSIKYKYNYQCGDNFACYYLIVNGETRYQAAVGYQFGKGYE